MNVPHAGGDDGSIYSSSAALKVISSFAGIPLGAAMFASDLAVAAYTRWVGSRSGHFTYPIHTRLSAPSLTQAVARPIFHPASRTG